MAAALQVEGRKPPEDGEGFVEPDKVGLEVVSSFDLVVHERRCRWPSLLKAEKPAVPSPPGPHMDDVMKMWLGASDCF